MQLKEALPLGAQEMELSHLPEEKMAVAMKLLSSILKTTRLGIVT